MNFIHRLARKLSILFGRRRFRNELDEEMAFHRDQAERDFIADRMTPEAATVCGDASVWQFDEIEGAQP